jgi:dihydroorotate dehydrogenase (fumarate)
MLCEKNKFLNASGCWISDENQITQLYKSNLGAIVIKTCTLFPKNGNLEPTYYKCDSDNIHINSKGLPNKGYEYYKNIYLKFNSDKLFILSIAWENKENTSKILKDYDSFINKTELIELNLSCPNLEHSIPAYDPILLNEILIFLNNLNLKNINFSLKLSPYLDHSLSDKIISVINTNNQTKIIKYIVLSNSIPNCLILKDSNFVLSKKYGGLSGKLNKYISLSNVYYFKNKLDKDIKIIGCGGIENIQDVNDYLNNGADFVQLASCFYDKETNSLDINKINKLIENYNSNMS